MKYRFLTGGAGRSGQRCRHNNDNRGKRFTVMVLPSGMEFGRQYPDLARASKAKAGNDEKRCAFRYG